MTCIQCSLLRTEPEHGSQMMYLIRIYPGCVAENDGAIELLHRDPVLQIPVLQGIAIHMHH